MVCSCRLRYGFVDHTARTRGGASTVPCAPMPALSQCLLLGLHSLCPSEAGQRGAPVFAFSGLLPGLCGSVSILGTSVLVCEIQQDTELTHYIHFTLWSSSSAYLQMFEGTWRATNERSHRTHVRSELGEACFPLTPKYVDDVC